MDESNLGLVQTEALTYGDLRFPHYLNSREVVHFNVKKDGMDSIATLTFSDVVAAAVLANLKMLFIADAGRGKTQLVTDINQHYFGGNGNWLQGRKDTKVRDLFVREHVDTSTGVYDSKDAMQLDEKKVKALLNVIDEINRSPGPVQSDFIDCGEAKFNHNGERIPLGRENYCMLLATANINKAGDNGFVGTFEMDRALLSRTHFTFDLDHPDFKPTVADKLELRKRQADPQLKTAPPRDISDKILEVYQTIKQRAAQANVANNLFAMILDYGLSYCDKDTKKHDKEGMFPMACLDCPLKDKLCSQVKSSGQRTEDSIVLMAEAMMYVAELKEGSELVFDQFQALTQAYRFTTYHGNLNALIADDEHHGRKQVMMDEVAVKMKTLLDGVAVFVDPETQALHPKLLAYIKPGEDQKITVYTQRFVDNITAANARTRDATKHIQYKVMELADVLKTEGIGSAWINDYTVQQ